MEAAHADLDFSKVLETADKALREGDWPAGRRGYESVLEKDPDNLDAKVGIEFIEFLEGGRKSRFYFPIEGTPKELWEERFANEALNKEEFELGQTRLRSFPSTCHIEHTTRCNFYCPHCTKGYDPYVATDLPREVIDKALDSLLPHLITADLTGFGEPTVGSQYGHIMKRLTQMGVMPQMNTNTSTLGVPHIELLVRSQARVTLSIDGATRETFEAIRAGGDWDRLVYSLHAIRRIRGIYGGLGWFAVTFVAMKSNIHELPEMVRLAKEFGLDQLLVQDYQPMGIRFDEQSLRNEPLRANKFFDEAERLAEDLGVSLVLPPRYAEGVPSPVESLPKRFLSSKRLFPKRKRFPQRCPHPWKNARVKYDGEVTPCCFSMSAMGDLKSQEFGQIWNGRRYRFFRWRVHTFFPPPECRLCHVYEGINQGNPGNVKLQEGMLLKALYFLETGFARWFERLRKGKEPPANFFRGKPLKPGATPSPTSQERA